MICFSFKYKSIITNWERAQIGRKKETSLLIISKLDTYFYLSKVISLPKQT